MSVEATAFLATPTGPFSGVECRIALRHLSQLETTCQPVAARGDDDPVWSADVRDISVRGIGLLLKRRFERGAILAIEMPATDLESAYTRLAKVVHTTAYGNGKWLLGCSLV